MSTTQRDRVGEIYDERAEMAEVLGGNVHVGYWLDDDDRTPLLEALNRCTDRVGSKLELRPGQRLLDVGCGSGVPATRIGQRTDALITGITNSEWQVADGTRRVNDAGLRGQVRIEYGDAAALAFPDESFDAVLAFESLPHAEDRGQWLREMTRVLRPGGRIVLTDFTEEAPLTDSEVEILAATGLQRPLPLAEVVDAVAACGLVVDETEDCGDRIRRSYPAFFDRLAQRRSDFTQAFGEARLDTHEQGHHAVLAVYRDKIGYVILAGHKPT